ncbi:MAG: hypothetical protein AVDCRST_MAG79-974, partial [uncultured Thermoleophilia bacterium]
AALPVPLQLHAGDVGPDDREPGGPPRRGAVVHRVGRREAPRVLVRLRQPRRLHALGSARQRLHGRGRPRARRRGCARHARHDRPPHRRRDDGRPAPGRAGPVRRAGCL